MTAFVAFVVFVVSVFLFCYGCARQYRVRQSQRHIARAVELLLWQMVVASKAEAPKPH